LPTGRFAETDRETRWQEDCIRIECAWRPSISSAVSDLASETHMAAIARSHLDRPRAQAARRAAREGEGQMPWSLRLGEVAGIEIYAHATFLLLVGLVAASLWAETHSPAAVLDGVSFIVALFACVLLHELGHAFAAHIFGIRTRDITLLPVGGLGRLERIPEKPAQELWIALAGPATSIVIGLALAAVAVLTSPLTPAADVGMVEGPLIERLALVNVLLAAFNLLPAFPMDGGRILRAGLALRLDYTRATQIAAGIGQSLAFGLGIIGVFWNPLLVLVALFVWVGAYQESRVAGIRAALSAVPVHAAMRTDFAVLSPADSLARATELALRHAQHDFPVMDGDSVVGVLTSDALRGGVVRRGSSSTVGESMLRRFEVADPSEPLERAFIRMQGGQCPTLVVMFEGRAVGLLGADSVAEFLRLRPAQTPIRP
jgi:Zn-dependent protease/predicted transcriptional regulator